MKLIWFAASAALLLTGGGSSVQGNEPTQPQPPYTLRILPNAPVSVLGPDALAGRSRVLLSYPMVVVEKDPSLYPMAVARGRDAEYPIHIVAPVSVRPTTVKPSPAPRYTHPK